MSLRPGDIPRSTIDALERGEREAANLAESLAIDQRRLAVSSFPGLSESDVTGLAPDVSITARMRSGGRLMLEHLGVAGLDRARRHPSDTVRGWACYALALVPRRSMGRRLRDVRPLADDPHFGVREWAWLAMRPHLAADIDAAIELLVPWTNSRRANVRRFASEATRPRGVWCAHLRELRDEPWRALPILEPLRADETKYVQDSVANWLNDASKDQPGWVFDVTERWLGESDSPPTERIARRARRSLPAAAVRTKPNARSARARR